IRFLIKTAPAADTIISDLGTTLPLLINDAEAYEPIASSDAAIQAQGSVYLYRDPTIEAALAARDPGYGFLGTNTEFTVQIPRYNPGNQDALHVAVWRANGASAPVVVNYFEFSQEPDHEWIEIVNVADYDLDP